MEWAVLQLGPAMTSHPWATGRIDAPTIAFDSQPTVSVPMPARARDLLDHSTSSTLRPVIGLPSREAPTVATALERDNGKGVVWLSVVCLFLGVAAGHLVRRGDSYAAALADLTSSTHDVRARRTCEVISAHTLASSARAKDVGSSSRVEIRAARKGARAAAPSTRPRGEANPIDSLFIDFEPTFRAPR